MFRDINRGSKVILWMVGIFIFGIRVGGVIFEEVVWMDIGKNDIRVGKISFKFFGVIEFIIGRNDSIVWSSCCFWIELEWIRWKGKVFGLFVEFFCIGFYILEFGGKMFV